MLHVYIIFNIFQTTLNEFEAVPPIIASDPVFREIVKNEEAEEKEQVYILYILQVYIYIYLYYISGQERLQGVRPETQSSVRT